jgi:translocation protein SEC63
MAILLLVIDDENSTVYTAGAIVTVTVTLTRKDMAHLFGDDTVKEKTLIEESKTEADKDKNEAEDPNPAVAKRPAWLRQRKVQKKSHSKKGSNKKAAPPKPSATTGAGDNSVSSQQSNSSPKSKKEKKEEKESAKENHKEKSNGLKYSNIRRKCFKLLCVDYSS